MCEPRFAARIVVMQKIEIMLVSVYLWVSEGFSEKNIKILKQIKMLGKLTNKPYIILGDFNIDYTEFVRSEWLDLMDVDPLHPKVNSTTTMSDCRVIDFALISRDIRSMFIGVYPMYSSPWGPHFSFVFEFHFHPLSVMGDTVCIPKALPMKQFTQIWKTIPEEQQQVLYNNASNRAKKLLQKQYKKTGFEILGKPTKALLNLSLIHI